MNKRLMSVVMLVWVSLVAASLSWDWWQIDASVMALARIEANSHFEKDLAYRRWVSLQGGVYIPPTERTPPNPYLIDRQDRDLTTTAGKSLTLVNPAYMTRQVHELAAESNGVLGHITSLKPLRPENAPDEWEERALLTFETGAKEALSLEHTVNGTYLRFMRPLATEASCLGCHETQGYRVGDVRGGISVAVPFAPFAEIAENQHRTLLLGHGLIGILGLAGLWAGDRRLQRSASALEQSLKTAERMAAEEELLLSSLGEGVYGVDNAGKCIFINSYALEMLGFGENEVIGQDQHQQFHSRKPDGSTYPHEECPIYITLRDGVKRMTEDVFVRKTGQMFPVSLTVTPMRREGVIVGTIVAFHDITTRQQAEEALKESERRLREAQRVAGLGSWELDLASNALSWSDEVFHIFEIDPKSFNVSYDAFLALIHPEDRERVNHAFTESLKNRRPYEITHRLLLPKGTVKYVHERSETSYAADGKPLRSTGTVQDVTMDVLKEESLRESEERFRTIADYTYDWEYWQGPQGEFLYISPSCQRVTGYTQSDFISRPNLVYEIIVPEDRSIMDAHLTDIRHEDQGSLDYRILHKEGGIRWIAHGCRAVYAKDGRFLGRRASNRDITDRKIAEAAVERLAYFDTLTALPNRRMLLDRIGQALTQAQRFGRSLAIMFLDLDNFKTINDTFGHDVGDELLKEVAARLVTCVRRGDTVARQGGDEFVIVLAEIADPHDATLVAEKVIAILDNPISVAGQVLRVTTSIGIAVHPLHGTDDVRELMKKADKAMYAAKAGGRNGYRFFAS